MGYSSNQYTKYMGLIKKFFVRYFTKKLMKDEEFVQNAEEYEEAIENLREEIIELEKEGFKVPDGIKKRAGLK